MAPKTRSQGNKSSASTPNIAGVSIADNSTNIPAVDRNPENPVATATPEQGLDSLAEGSGQAIHEGTGTPARDNLYSLLQAEQQDRSREENADFSFGQQQVHGTPFPLPNVGGSHLSSIGYQFTNPQYVQNSPYSSTGPQNPHQNTPAQRTRVQVADNGSPMGLPFVHNMPGTGGQNLVGQPNLNAFGTGHHPTQRIALAFPSGSQLNPYQSGMGSGNGLGGSQLPFIGNGTGAGFGSVFPGQGAAGTGQFPTQHTQQVPFAQNLSYFTNPNPSVEERINELFPELAELQDPLGMPQSSSNAAFAGTLGTMRSSQSQVPGLGGTARNPPVPWNTPVENQEQHGGSSNRYQTPAGLHPRFPSVAPTTPATPSTRPSTGETPATGAEGTATVLDNDEWRNNLVSDEIPRLPADEPIDPTPRTLGTGRTSGLNQFAYFGDDTEPRTRYILIIERGRNETGRGGAAHDYPSSKTPLPARLTLREICASHPNHVWGTGLRLFLAEGVTPEMIWRMLPPSVRRHDMRDRPWNYQQQASIREKRQMFYETTGVKILPTPKNKKDGKRRASDKEDKQNSGGDDNSTSKKQKTTLTADEELTSPEDNLGEVTAQAPPARPVAARHRWRAVEEEDYTIYDYRHRYRFRLTTAREYARQILRSQDPDFDDLDLEEQTFRLEEAFEARMANWAAIIRQSHNLQPSGEYRLDANPFVAMQRIAQAEFRQREGEAADAYQARIIGITWTQLVAGIEHLTVDIRKELELEKVKAEAERQDDEVDKDGEFELNDEQDKE